MIRKLNFRIQSKQCLIISIVLLTSLFIAPPSYAAQSLEFIVENETFFKNLEHTGIDRFNEGFTIFGDIVKPFFRYKPFKRATIDAGFLLELPFGNDQPVDQKEPIISIKLDFNQWLDIIAGTLDRRHRLPDAFFNDDLEYTEPIEQGFQFLIDTDRFRQDTWINWEIKETLTRREKLSIGDVSRFQYGGFMIEGLLYWVHFGGQKNSENGVINNLSLGAGAGYSVFPKKKGERMAFIDEAGFTLHYLINRHTLQTPTVADPETEGNGILGKVFIKLWDSAELYYQQWKSDDDQFRTLKGDPLYKATDYKEVGIEKSWLIGKGVFFTAGLKGQWVESSFVHIDSLSIGWRGDFPLFEDYFNKRN